MADRILFVVGASGSGKTAALEHLRSLPDFDGACYFFDEIGVPTEAEIRELDDRGISWQAQATCAWIEKLAGSQDGLAILEGQTTPTCIAAEAERAKLPRWRTVLLDCDAETRGRRLGRRGQPELATPRMDNWAAYLRGQADALQLSVLDTSALTIAEVAGAVRRLAEQL